MHMDQVRVWNIQEERLYVKFLPVWMFTDTFTFWLAALALHFTETVEEFEDSIMQKKMKIPKMSIKYSGNSIENHFEEDRLPLRHKKVRY